MLHPKGQIAALDVACADRSPIRATNYALVSYTYYPTRRIAPCGILGWFALIDLHELGVVHINAKCPFSIATT